MNEYVFTFMIKMFEFSKIINDSVKVLCLVIDYDDDSITTNREVK